MTFKGLLGSYPKVNISLSHSFKHALTKWGFHSLIKLLDVLALSEQKLESSRTSEVISVCGHLPSHQSLLEENCSEKRSVALHTRAKGN